MLVPGLAAATAPQSTPSEIIRLAADVGLRAIEWSADGPIAADPAVAAQVRADCRAAGIGVCSYDSGYRAGPDDPAAFTAALRTTQALGAPILRLEAGGVGSADASLADWSRTVHALRNAVATAADAGIRIGLRHRDGTLADTPAAMSQLLREVSRDSLGSSWRPRSGQGSAAALAEFHALLPALLIVELRTAAPAGPTVPAAAYTTGQQAGSLAGRAELWRPLLAELAAAGSTRFALLGLRDGDLAEDVRRDAAALLEWLP